MEARQAGIAVEGALAHLDGAGADDEHLARRIALGADDLARGAGAQLHELEQALQRRIG